MVDRRINSLKDAEQIINDSIADREWMEEADNDMRKARLFASDILVQARENDISGGCLVGAACYFMAATLAATTTKGAMVESVRTMIVENAVMMMRTALKEMQHWADEEEARLAVRNKNQ